MGSINYIYKPEKWKIVSEGQSKISPDDYIYKMVIGWCDDELSSGEISDYISKEVYDNLLSGKYFISYFPYHEKKIVVFDKDNNIIPLIKGKEEKYNIDQISIKPKVKKLVK